MEMTANDHCDSFFRVLASGNVKYISVKGSTYDTDTLYDMPLEFETLLHPLGYHDENWVSVYISRNQSSQELELAMSSDPLPGVQTIWHPQMINFLDLERTKSLAVLTQECKWKTPSSTSQDERMIAKMARFAWEIRYLEAESKIYQLVEGQDIAPKFLGHIHEAGRVIGMLLEKAPNGRHAESADLEICEAALRRFHALGYLHGDCNKYNFIILPDGKVFLIDFDNARACTDARLLDAEVESLKEQLAETTGRGGGFMPYDEEEDN